MNIRICLIIFSVVLLGCNCVSKKGEIDSPKLHRVKGEKLVYFEQENTRFYLDTLEFDKLKDFISCGEINLKRLHDSLHYENCNNIVSKLKDKAKDKQILNDLYYNGYKGNSIKLIKTERLEEIDGEITLVLVCDNPCYLDGNASIVKLELKRGSDGKLSLLSMNYEGSWL